MFCYEECLKKYSTVVERKGKPPSSFSTQTDSLTRKIPLENSTVPQCKRYMPRHKKDMWLPHPELNCMYGGHTCPGAWPCACPAEWITTRILFTSSILAARCLPWVWNVKVLHSPFLGGAHLGKFGFLVFVSFPLALLIHKLCWNYHDYLMFSINFFLLKLRNITVLQQLL